MRGLLAIIGIAILALSVGGIIGMQVNFWWGLCSAGIVIGLCLLIDAMIREK